MKKKIISILLTAILVLLLLPMTAFAADHTHGEGDDKIEFQAWNSADSLPDSAGNWYLTGDVTLSETWTAPAGTSEETPAITNLCLKGHVIKMADSGSVIEVPQYATLNI